MAELREKVAEAMARRIEEQDSEVVIDCRPVADTALAALHAHIEEGLEADSTRFAISKSLVADGAGKYEVAPVRHAVAAALSALGLRAISEEAGNP